MPTPAQDLATTAAALDSAVASLHSAYSGYVAACAAYSRMLMDGQGYGGSRGEAVPERFSTTAKILEVALASDVTMQRALSLGRFDPSGPQSATALHVRRGDIPEA